MENNDACAPQPYSSGLDCDVHRDVANVSVGADGTHLATVALGEHGRRSDAAGAWSWGDTTGTWWASTGDTAWGLQADTVATGPHTIDLERCTWWSDGGDRHNATYRDNYSETMGGCQRGAYVDGGDGLTLVSCGEFVVQESGNHTGGWSDRGCVYGTSQDIAGQPVSAHYTHYHDSWCADHACEYDEKMLQVQDMWEPLP